MTSKINNILIPNVSKLPGQQKVDLKDKLGNEGRADEFKNLLQEQFAPTPAPLDPMVGQHGIRLSTHAAKRLQERDLQMDGNEFFKIKGAIEKLKSKGGRDSLVITNKAAYIVDVANNKIVTAIDKGNMAENVFTKIDSTLFVD